MQRLLKTFGRVMASVKPSRHTVPIISKRNIDSRPFSATPQVHGLPFVGAALANDHVKPEFKCKPFLVPLERKQVHSREKPMPSFPDFIVTLNPEDVGKDFCGDGKEKGIVLSQGKDWSSLRRPISKYMLTPGVIKDYNSEFNGISKDLVSYVQQQGNGPEGVSVLQDSATSFFKLTHECNCNYCDDEGPMKEWNTNALFSLQEELKNNVRMKPGLIDKLHKAAGGFLDRAETQMVENLQNSAEQMGEVLCMLRGKRNTDFYIFCRMLRESNYGVWAAELERKAREFKGCHDRCCSGNDADFHHRLLHHGEPYRYPCVYTYSLFGIFLLVLLIVHIAAECMGY